MFCAFAEVHTSNMETGGMPCPTVKERRFAAGFNLYVGCYEFK
jgi:hypothetical protein